MKKKIRVRSYKRNGKRVRGHTKRVRKKAYEADFDNSISWKEELAKKGLNPGFRYIDVLPMDKDVGMPDWSRNKVRKSMLRHGDITIFQPGPVPADRRIRSGRNIYSVGLSPEQEKSNREAEKRLRKLMGY